jgi:phage terminase small subunit
MGVLTEADGLALESLCEAYSDLRSARAALAAAQEITYATVNSAGNLMHRGRPENALIADADRRVRMWLSAFGLTPSDRARVSAVDRADEYDPAARFLSPRREYLS